MFLEKLEIQGFKSFANKNKLIFSGILKDHKKGITAIVGPNGSGKSNIADAVRWALGEQSLKTLRSKRNKDIIFSGSDKKARLSFAEVSLFLNNENKIDLNYNDLDEAIRTAEQVNTIDSDKSDTEELDKEQINKNKLDEILQTQSEIIITRRAYRNGESEYLLNGLRVRLADIQMLLAKANVGQKTYSVIGQGVVENFLNSSAAEKKDFFDEATGVKQFQIKRDLALSRLESSYENLQQVDLLLSEIKPRLKSLTRQIDKLKKRDYLEKELHKLQLNYYGFSWQNINSKLDELNQKYLVVENQKINLENKIYKINKELDSIQSAELNIKINALQPIWRDLDKQKVQQEKRLTKLQADLETDLELQGEFDLSWLNNKAQELKNDLKEIGLNIESLDKSRPQEKQKLLSEKADELEQKIKQAVLEKNNLKNLEQSAFLLEQQRLKIEEERIKLISFQENLDLKSLQEKYNTTKKEISNIEKSIQSEDKVFASLQTDEKSLNNELEKIKKELNETNNKLNKLAEKIKKSAELDFKNQEIYQLVEEFLQELGDIKKMSDLNIIKNYLTRAKDNFAQKIKAILKLKPESDAFRWQELQNNLLSLIEERQKLNERLQGIHAKTNNSQSKLFQLKQTLNSLQSQLNELKNNLNRAKDNSELEKLHQAEFKNKQETESLKAEIKIRANKLVVIDTLVAERDLILTDLQSCQIEDSLISEKINLREENKRTLQLELTEIEEKLKKHQNKLTTSDIQVKIQEVEEIIKKLDLEIEKINIKLTNLRKQQAAEKNLMFSYQKDTQQKQSLLNDLNENLSQLKIQATREETRLEDLEKNIHQDRLSLKDIKNQEIVDDFKDLSTWENSINNYKRQLEQIGSIDPETEQEYEETKNRYNFLNQQTLDLNGAIKSLEQIIYKLDINIKTIFDKEFKLISEKFNEYFQILFNGGTAKISKIMLSDLENEKNKESVLTPEITHPSSPQEELQFKVESNFEKLKLLKKYSSIGLQGIDIQATPPGKKIQSMAMLSGGERALTAIALICAIISTNPSPFVVLDEVDAALDESNSERLAKILDDLSNKTQFIIITHNRASMRKADILYGITMSSDGVSQLISIKLDEIKTQDNKILLTK